MCNETYFLKYLNNKIYIFKIKLSDYTFINYLNLILIFVQSREAE